jgi:hypothetical protein
MIKAVASTIAAVMLTAFMLRDRTWDDRPTVIMVAILWLVAVWMWKRLADERHGNPS